MVVEEEVNEEGKIIFSPERERERESFKYLQLYVEAFLAQNVSRNENIQGHFHSRPNLCLVSLFLFKGHCLFHFILSIIAFSFARGIQIGRAHV